MAILHSHRNILQVVEHARVHVEDGRVVEVRADSGRLLTWNIPHANLACLLLGQGSSITQEAARLLAAERVLVGLCGTAGTPLFLAAAGEYRPTDRALAWMERWRSPAWRLAAAKSLHLQRISLVMRRFPRHAIAPPEELAAAFEVAIRRAVDLDSLRGAEAAFAKALYAHTAAALGVPWRGRIRDDDQIDLPNRRLDSANYLAYGVAATALWICGVPFFLPVQHGTSRAGGLVFDAADVLKDATCLPLAFKTSHLPWPQARETIVQDLQQIDAIALLIAWLDNALALPEAA